MKKPSITLLPELDDLESTESLLRIANRWLERTPPSHGVSATLRTASARLRSLATCLDELALQADTEHLEGDSNYGES